MLRPDAKIPAKGNYLQCIYERHAVLLGVMDPLVQVPTLHKLHNEADGRAAVEAGPIHLHQSLGVELGTELYLPDECLVLCQSGAIFGQAFDSHTLVSPSALINRAKAPAALLEQAHIEKPSRSWHFAATRAAVRKHVQNLLCSIGKKFKKANTIYKSLFHGHLDNQPGR